MKLIYKKSKYGWGENGRADCYIGTSPNTTEGNELFQCLRHLFKPYGSINRRGRNPNRKEVAMKYGLDHDSLRQDLPIKYSTSFDVYFYPKSNIKTPPSFHTMDLTELKRLCNNR
jgi:hypothetical protein